MAAADLELFKLIDGPLIGTDHKRRMKALMEHFCAQGRSLVDCADPRRLKRSTTTLQGYARRFGLAFPDYLPRALMNKVEGMYYLAGTGPANTYCRQCGHCGEAAPSRKGGKPVPGACLKLVEAMRSAKAAKNIQTNAACKYFEPKRREAA